MDTLVLAFAADPVERWLYPQPRDYLRHFPDFLASFGGRGDQRMVWQSAGSSAVAVWLPPGAEPDAEAIVTVLTDTVAPEKNLETPNPRNIPFYQRQDFDVVGRAAAGSCPPITFMLRPPR